DWLEHAVASGTELSGIGSYQRLVDQPAEQLERQRALDCLAADAFGRLERPAAGKRRQAPKERLLARRKQLVAPGDSRANRLVPRRPVASFAAQQRQPA